MKIVLSKPVLNFWISKIHNHIYHENINLASSKPLIQLERNIFVYLLYLQYNLKLHKSNSGVTKVPGVWDTMSTLFHRAPTYLDNL